MLLDYISEIYNGHAKVRRDGFWGMIDIRGKLIIPCIYEQISTFSNYGIIVEKDGIVFVVDSNNNRIALINDDAGKEAMFEEKMHIPDENLTPIKQGEYWGYINAKGDIVIEPVFLEVKNFSNGRAPVLTKSGWYIISLKEYK